MSMFNLASYMAAKTIFSLPTMRNIARTGNASILDRYSWMLDWRERSACDLITLAYCELDVDARRTREVLRVKVLHHARPRGWIDLPDGITVTTDGDDLAAWVLHDDESDTVQLRERVSTARQIAPTVWVVCSPSATWRIVDLLPTSVGLLIAGDFGEVNVERYPVERYNQHPDLLAGLLTRLKVQVPTDTDERELRALAARTLLAKRPVEDVRGDCLDAIRLRMSKRDRERLCAALYMPTTVTA